MININKALAIPGWMSEPELYWLAERASESDIVVEFGSHLGRSTRALGDHVIEKVFAVDPWNSEYYDNENNPMHILGDNAYQEFHRNLKDLILDGKVIPQQHKAEEFDYPYRVDMVFLDGDHRYLEVKKDITKALKLVRTGGIIAGHDYTHPNWQGVKRAVDEMFGPVEILDSIWIARI